MVPAGGIWCHWCHVTQSEMGHDGVTEAIREELIMLDNLRTDIQLSRVTITTHKHTGDDKYFGALVVDGVTQWCF